MDNAIYDSELDQTVSMRSRVGKRSGWLSTGNYSGVGIFLIFVASAVAAMPIAGLCVLYGIAARVAWSLGHWPSYGQPDPKDLPDALAHAADVFGLLTSASVLVVLTSVIGFGLLRFVPPTRMDIAATALVLLCWLGVPVLFFADPCGVLTWFVD